MAGVVETRIIICCIALIVSLLCHWLIKPYFVAVVIAAVLADLLVLTLDTIVEGHVPYPVHFGFLIILGLYTLPIAWVVGIPFRQWRKYKPGHCLSCGYNLTGNTSGVCPECGEKIMI